MNNIYGVELNLHNFILKRYSNDFITIKVVWFYETCMFIVLPPKVAIEHDYQ